MSAPIAVAPGDRLVLRRGAGADRIVGGLVIDAVPARGVSRRRQTAERVVRLAAAVAAGDGVGARAARLDLHGVLDGEDGRSGAVAAPDVVETAESAILRAVGDEASLDDVRAVGRPDPPARGDDRPDGGPCAREASSSPGSSGTAGWCARAPRSDRPARARRRPRRIHTWRPRWIVWKPPWRSPRRRPWPLPPGPSGCPVDGIRELVRSGRIVELEPDLAYAATTYGALTDRALAMAATEPLTPAAFRDATGTSRKYVMAVLADLDRRGVLRRTPAGHVPGPRARVATGVGG